MPDKYIQEEFLGCESPDSEEQREVINSSLRSSIAECDRAQVMPTKRQNEKPRSFLEALTPSQCRNYEMAKDFSLCGDLHLARGGITLIAGVAGCGKSRVLTALAIAGAAGENWMGLPVHSKFRTFIVQAENGPARLKNEFSEIHKRYSINLDEYVKITLPPAAGIQLAESGFREELRQHIEEFRPGVLAFDPWNRMVLDDSQKDYKRAIDWILECLPDDPNIRPAVVIVSHLRKPISGEGRKRGRDLLQEISGSSIIASAARSAFVLQHASPDPEEERVIWTCAKNNDGELGPPSAWRRLNGLFERESDSTLTEFYKAGEAKRAKITEEHVKKAVGDGIKRGDAIKRLQEVAGVGKSSAYEALRLDGRFKEHLLEDESGHLCWG